MKFKLIIFLIESYLVAANIDPGITFQTINTLNKYFIYIENYKESTF